jgi:hypothetical protein
LDKISVLKGHNVASRKPSHANIDNISNSNSTDLDFVQSTQDAPKLSSFAGVEKSNSDEYDSDDL